MKLIALGFALLTMTPGIIGQESLHSFSTTGPANISFAADSMERQDPPGGSSDAYASVVHLKGNVVIRVCCMEKGTAGNQPKQALFFRGGDAVYRQDTSEIAFSGNTRVTFQNYPAAAAATPPK